MSSIEHGTSIEREIGAAKKALKELKTAGATEEEITQAREKYKELKTKGVTQQAEKKKVNFTKFEKALRKKLKGIEILKLKVARWTTQRPNAEQLAKIDRYDGLVQELVKLTKQPYLPSGTVSADNFENANATAASAAATTTTTTTPIAEDVEKQEYCFKFQVGKCTVVDCPHLHEMKPAKKKAVVPSGTKRKFDGDSDDEDAGDAGTREEDVDTLKAEWKKLKEDGGDKAAIKAAKKKYKKARKEKSP
jgi:hypothetical protein